MDYDVTKAPRPPSTLTENLEQPRRLCFDLRFVIALKTLEIRILLTSIMTS